MWVFFPLGCFLEDVVAQLFAHVTALQSDKTKRPSRAAQGAFGEMLGSRASSTEVSRGLFIFGDSLK